MPTSPIVVILGAGGHGEIVGRKRIGRSAIFQSSSQIESGRSGSTAAGATWPRPWPTALRVSAMGLGTSYGHTPIPDTMHWPYARSFQRSITSASTDLECTAVGLLLSRLPFFRTLALIIASLIPSWSPTCTLLLKYND